MFRILLCGDKHCAGSGLALADAVADGVLYEGLQGQGRQLEVCAIQFVTDVQSVAEAQLLQGDVVLHMLQLLLEGDRVVNGDRIHVVAQVPGKVGDGLGGRLRIDQADLLDHVQDVEEKMGLDLAEHEVDLELLVVQFLPAHHCRLVIQDDAQHDQHGQGCSESHYVDVRPEASQENTNDGQRQIGDEAAELARGNILAVPDQDDQAYDHEDRRRNEAHMARGSVVELAVLIHDDQIPGGLRDQQGDESEEKEDLQTRSEDPVRFDRRLGLNDDEQGDDESRDQREDVCAKAKQGDKASRRSRLGGLREFQQQKAGVVEKHAAEGHCHIFLGRHVFGRAVPDRDQGVDTGHDTDHFYD